MWLFFALGSAFFAGITAVLAKIGIEKVNSTLATALRTVVVLAFSWLMVFVVGSQGGIAQISGTTLLFLMLSGLSTGASWLCYFKALQLGDVNKVAPIDKSSTVLTILLAFIFLGEPVSIPQALGVVGIGVGTLLMITKKEVEDDKPHSKAWLVYAFLSAVFASLTSIFGKIGVENVESNLGTAIRTIVVLVMAWVMVFVTGEQKGIRSIGKKSWVFLFLSGITTGLSWLCYYRALQDGPASVVVPIDKLSILVTIVFSWIVLKEKLTPKAAVGLVLILAGTGAVIDLSQLKIGPCVGCFGCWVKTPGKCVIRDDACRVYPYLAKSTRLLLVSRVRYGSYDTVMKTMLERAIPIQQAFLRLVQGEIHHKMRDVAPKEATILGYGALSERERQVFSHMVHRNARNLQFSSLRLCFAGEEQVEQTAREEVRRWKSCY